MTSPPVNDETVLILTKICKKYGLQVHIPAPHIDFICISPDPRLYSGLNPDSIYEYIKNISIYKYIKIIPKKTLDRPNWMDIEKKLFTFSLDLTFSG